MAEKSQKCSKNKEKDEQLDMKELRTTWDPVDVISDELNWEKWAVKNIVKLLDDDNTIPFIARYRKEQTNNMEADKLRELHSKYEELKNVEQKIQSVIKSITKLEKMTPKLQTALLASQTTSEVDHLYAPYKSGSKRTLAERARELGLEKHALAILTDPRSVNLHAAVDTEKKGLAKIEDVVAGVQHIIADVIAKDKDTMDKIRELCKFAHVTLESTKAPQKEKQNADKKEKSEKPAPQSNKQDPNKFENYFNFTIPVKYAKPHQVLAINRGESLKILAVKVTIPEEVKRRFTQFCSHKWVRADASDYLKQITRDSIDDAYKRLIQPLMIRHFRSELTRQAEKASVDVFAANLKSLLLTPPVRGRVVMGMDPGFRNGCKYCIVAPNGQVLDQGVAHLHTKSAFLAKEVNSLAEKMKKYRCETVAIGNGTACRETERFFSDNIKRGTFRPLNVVYCIVNEAGASIYSASDDAKKEMPDLDINIRGAVSIGRRLQDPLAELVKIEPRHLGVGMYQHDVSALRLAAALTGVVEDAVSFVGVDVNTASLALLRRIAGMNVARAKKVIEHREKVAAFVNRRQILDVKGIGPKVFEQCAGFVRVVPETRGQADDSQTESDAADGSSKMGSKRKAPAKAGGRAKKQRLTQQPEPLDMTSIHPESYPLADRVIKDASANKDNIGDASFIQQMSKYFATKSLASLAAHYGCGEPTLRIIMDGLQQPLGHDIRHEFEQPLFKRSVTSLGDLKRGATVTGKVTNVTHFGAFVDIGVGQDGLIHTSKMNPALMRGKRSLDLGDRVEVEVESVEAARKRIALRLKRLM